MKSSEVRDAVAAAETADAALWASSGTPAIAAAGARPDWNDASSLGRDVPPLSLAWSVRFIAANLRTALPLAVADQLALAAALAASAAIVPRASASGALPNLYGALGGGLLLSFYCARLYPGIGLTPRAEASRCVGWTGLTFLIVWFASLSAAAPRALAIALALACACSALLAPLFRLCVRRVLARSDWWAQPMLVVSDEPPQRIGALMDRVLERRSLGWRAVALLNGDSPPVPVSREGADEMRAARMQQEMDQIVRCDGVYRAMVLLPELAAGEFSDVVERTARWIPKVWLVGSTRQSRWPLVVERACEIGDYRLIELRNRLRSPTAMLIKRMFDLCVSAVAGIVALPCMLLIAAAVKLSSSGPAMYTQQRIGRGGEPFRMWKFRTMFSDAEEVLEDFLERHADFKEQWERDRKLSSDPRVVPYIGSFLRKCSLDELPQLWNVLRGEMTLVGPRPLPEYHLAQFEPSFREYRAQVTPGITGLWQVSSRGKGEAEMYVHCDSQYIRNWSLWLDLKVLINTFGAVVSGRGAS